MKDKYSYLAKDAYMFKVGIVMNILDIRYIPISSDQFVGMSFFISDKYKPTLFKKDFREPITDSLYSPNELFPDGSNIYGE
jgi:hypothetical protein